ncbi:MAG TPA: proton-conducting transporter membrane subunit [Acidimicrobiales bacterium]|nr:proton-conducting transporter membrane subunit [Acidimicrobiales bacterium]
MSSAGLSSLLPLPIAVPITAAVLSPLVARVSKRAALVVCILAMAAAGGLLLLEAPKVLGGYELTHFLGHWAPFSGQQLGDTLAADPFGLTYALAVSAIGTVLLICTLSELPGLGPRELGAYACLFELLLAALIGSALTADMVNLFVWFEVAALASYGLTGFFLERPIALEAAFKILVLTNMAGFAVFVGAAMLYSGDGALNFGQLHHALQGHTGPVDMVALGLLLMGFGTKAGIMPFHGWLPDAHTAAPGPVSALFSGLMVDLGIVAIARLSLQIYAQTSSGALLGMLTVFGCVSAVLGAVLALAQDDLKRLLAYDTISQMGILLVGFASARSGGVAGAVYHLVSHSLFKALLFLCAGAVVHATGLTKLSEMGGLARPMPIISGAFVVGAAAIAGVPPLNGYVSLGLIHDSLRDHDPVAFGVLLVAQIITVAALARACHLAFFRRRPRPHGDMEDLHPGMITGLAVLAVGCVASGVLAYPILHRVAEPAAGGLLSPGRYARGVLHSGTTLPVPHVSFEFFSASGLGLSLGMILAGLVLAAAYIRRPEPRPVTWLRAAHNGSVNDYASYFAVGGILTVAVLLIRT